jgi:hypothetical protein
MNYLKYLQPAALADAFAFPATGISFASGSYDFFISDSEAVFHE